VIIQTPIEATTSQTMKTNLSLVKVHANHPLLMSPKKKRLSLKSPKMIRSPRNPKKSLKKRKMTNQKSQRRRRMKSQKPSPKRKKNQRNQRVKILKRKSPKNLNLKVRKVVITLRMTHTIRFQTSIRI